MPPDGEPPEQALSSYEFTLVVDGSLHERSEGLQAAGCVEASLGSVDGVHYAAFRWTAPSFADALASAITAVECVPGVRVRRVEPDNLVTASEIAERLGRSRESVRLLVTGARGSGDFPAPASHLGARQRLWRWSEVASWSGHLDQDELDRARVVAALNAALELRAHPSRVRDFVRRFLEDDTIDGTTAPTDTGGIRVEPASTAPPGSTEVVRDVDLATSTDREATPTPGGEQTTEGTVAAGAGERSSSGRVEAGTMPGSSSSYWDRARQSRGQKPAIAPVSDAHRRAPRRRRFRAST